MSSGAEPCGGGEVAVISDATGGTPGAVAQLVSHLCRLPGFQRASTEPLTYAETRQRAQGRWKEPDRPHLGGVGLAFTWASHTGQLKGFIILEPQFLGV